MLNQPFRRFLTAVLIILTAHSYAQSPLTLQEALSSSTSNYGSIKAKEDYLQSAYSSVEAARRSYMPNVIISAQHVYGTINGQNGPLYSFPGGVASSGLPLKEQNWNAAFGSLYLANINWEFFSFGKASARTKAATAWVNLREQELNQEVFQHQVKVIASYLNVLAAQRIVHAQSRNLERAVVFQKNVLAKALGGLIAGVDSSQANAEVSNAKISLTKAADLQQEETKKLALLTGLPEAAILVDTVFVTRIPEGTAGEETALSANHPTASFYRARINQSNRQQQLIAKSYFPSFTLVGVFQGRGSGFNPEYLQDQTAYSDRYADGIKPTRANYLLGIGLVWNLTSLTQTRAQSKVQSFNTLAYQKEFQLVDEQLKSQLAIADEKLANAMNIYHEVPIQVQSAQNAYTQKNALYANGLTTMLDVTQTLYILNRAETDKDLAYINVWQALLFKAAAIGDLTLFTNEL